MARIDYTITNARRGYEVVMPGCQIATFPTRKAAERFVDWNNVAHLCVQWCCALPEYPAVGRASMVHQ